MARINTRRHIADILVKRDIISEEDLERALVLLEEEPADSNRRIGQILYQDLPSPGRTHRIHRRSRGTSGRATAPYV